MTDKREIDGWTIDGHKASGRDGWLEVWDVDGRRWVSGEEGGAPADVVAAVLPDDVLVAELRARGWECVAPLSAAIRSHWDRKLQEMGREGAASGFYPVFTVPEPDSDTPREESITLTSFDAARKAHSDGLISDATLKAAEAAFAPSCAWCARPESDHGHDRLCPGTTSSYFTRPI